MNYPDLITLQIKFFSGQQTIDAAFVQSQMQREYLSKIANMRVNYQVTNTLSTLCTSFPTYSRILSSLLTFNPAHRVTAKEALEIISSK